MLHAGCNCKPPYLKAGAGNNVIALDVGNEGAARALSIGTPSALGAAPTFLRLGNKTLACYKDIPRHRPRRPDFSIVGLWISVHEEPTRQHFQTVEILTSSIV